MDFYQSVPGGSVSFVASGSFPFSFLFFFLFRFLVILSLFPPFSSQDSSQHANRQTGRCRYPALGGDSARDLRRIVWSRTEDRRATSPKKSGTRLCRKISDSKCGRLSINGRATSLVRSQACAEPRQTREKRQQRLES
ncbi:uncharacterized protein P884DRAFT_96735 [Thermothelomyces heterothallicus CBS 202.75]|uniref:uncharacterized protein n=1 Tax=Thermothelomyces heterothallicus CBS 202.75 TaxID=1149848 RepID=UPI0037421561